MKKTITKSLSVLLAIVMLVGILCAPAFADDKLGETSTHTYDAYQIFEGDLSGGKMVQIKWGSGVNSAALLNDLKSQVIVNSVAIFGNCTTAAEVAKVIADLDESADLATLKKVEKIVYNNLTGTKTSNVSNGSQLVVNGKAGYFLLVDSTNTDNVEGGVKNLLILKVTNSNGISIKSKVNVPSVEKKVMDANDTAPVAEDWQDSADHDIDDPVQFKLTAKLATISDYETYKIVFHDNLSKGLKFKDDAVIYVNNSNKGSISLSSSSDDGNGGKNLVFSIEDVKGTYGATDNDKVSIVYSAELTTDCVIGSAGNPNTVYLQYSNNPYDSQAGNNTPGTNKNLGKTPVDKVTVFTYKLKIDKVDQDDQALTGATFTLSKKVGNNYNIIGSVDGANLSTFEWKGLDDGEYKLEETVVPEGYNKAEDVVFTITATHEDNATDPRLLTLTTDKSDLNVNVNSGEISGTVKNVIGDVLPETGGMGTTLFYVIGSLLVLGAGVVLVTKRRMDD